MVKLLPKLSTQVGLREKDVQQTPKQWARRWGICARMSGTPEASSGMKLLSGEELKAIMDDPRAQESLRMVEENVFGQPTTVGVAMRCLHQTEIDDNQKRAIELFKKKRSDNLALFTQAEKAAV